MTAADGKGSHEDRARSVIDLAESRGQGHVFRFYDELAPDQQARLVAQVAGLDFDRLDQLIASRASQAHGGPGSVEPAPLITLPESDDDRARADEARAAGEQMLREGRVAVLTVAGGQGTRLGFPKPKGLYPVGPITDRTLFELYAQKILAASRRYGKPILWMVLTSPATHAETVEYFERHDFLGVPRDDVRFLMQGTMPAIDADGKLLLASRDSLALSPNGHGGSLLALREEGGLDAMRERGADCIYYFQVDNPMVPVPDPAFLGYHRAAGAEMSTKVVPKTDPLEKVGVVCRADGKTCVIEYSDLDEERMHAREDDGKLLYRAGNIAVHALDRAFVERLTEGGQFRLPYHFASKKVPHIDSDGNLVKPTEPNGTKFETFVFDALPEATKSVTQEVERADEFAPVKNAEGSDSPATSRRALIEQYGGWLEAAGVEVPRDAEGQVAGAVEISPRFAADASECAERIASMKDAVVFRDGLILDEESIP